ncbi:MAG: DNA cytosine methyltransferase [Deltaproteobacteria bacterium]|jgi:DNA (cytosine-5)-methyltransferase 1|nr:DNA cytosine methyltransferase [Deltaproteobacteria bacterium]
MSAILKRDGADERVLTESAKTPRDALNETETPKRALFPGARSLELFSGAGGLALGLHQAGLSPVALLERDKDSRDAININIASGLKEVAGWKTVRTDLRLVGYADYASEANFVTGGPPRQPFSLGGEHKAYEDSRDMFSEAVRAARELKPLGFIFENVRGLTRQSFSSYFNYITLQLSFPDIIKRSKMTWEDRLRALEEYRASKGDKGLEYDVVSKLVNAADYGVPRTRHRVFIVGFRKDLNALWSFPEPTRSREALLIAKNGDSSYWEERRVAKKDRPEAPRAEERRARLFDKLIYGERWRTVRDALKGLPDPKSDSAKNFFNHEYRGGARAYAGRGGSLLDAPSKTIKAGTNGVPGGENALALGDGEIRYYTVRESARIQTFPDNYQFSGSWSESVRRIGDAAPVKLAYVIGASVIKRLKEIAR